jgi:hypothetical protein
VWFWETCTSYIITLCSRDQPVADAHRKARDGVAVDAGPGALSSDRHTFAEGSKGGDLVVEREAIHGVCQRASVPTQKKGAETGGYQHRRPNNQSPTPGR